MPCYTKVKVAIEETEYTARARKELGLPLQGRLV